MSGEKSLGEPQVPAPLPDVIQRLLPLTKQSEDYIWRPAREAIAEISRLRDALKAVRVYVQDCIENGHDRTMLGNMYGARDEIDTALAAPTSKSDAAREMEKAMGPRANPLHPMFRDHNCAYCGSGQKPCKQGNPSQCEYPHARND